jgi:CheY-like chemotaxis protein
VPALQTDRPEPTMAVGKRRSGLGLRRLGNTAGPTLAPASRCDDHAVTFSVLIVDDDPDFLGLAARILVDLGVESVSTAASASDALAAVRESRPDAVLVDIGLPDRNGIDLGYELARLSWRPRVVLTSSDIDAIHALGGDGGRPDLPFLAKEELVGDTLRRTLLDG